MSRSCLGDFAAPVRRALSDVCYLFNGFSFSFRYLLYLISCEAFSGIRIVLGIWQELEEDAKDDDRCIAANGAQS